MPSFQIIDANPDPVAQAAGNFGTGFSDALKRAREREQQQDMLNQILRPQQPQNPPPPNQQSPKAPNNINEVLNNINNHPDILGPMGIVEGQNPQSNKVNRVTPEKLAALELHVPGAAKALKPVAEMENFKNKESIKQDVKRSGEYLSKVEKIREGIARKELSLRQIENAIKSRSNLDFLGDQLAAMTGVEGLRSAKGAQLLSATKEFFLSDLGSIPGLRPNQFLERALSSAFTDPSRTDEANEMIYAGMKANLMLDKVKTELTSQLRSYYQNTLGYVPATISEEVDKRLTPFAQQISDNWANDVQKIENSHDKNIQKFRKDFDSPYKRKVAAEKVKLKKAIPGAVLDETMGLVLLEKYGDDEAKALEAARKLGYKIPGEQ